MSGHTPGPWHVIEPPWDKSACVVVSGNGDPHSGELICSTDEGSWDDHTEEADPLRWQANARLIAAAPDLLAACKLMIEARDRTGQWEKTDVALSLMRDAVDKAEGTS